MKAVSTNAVPSRIVYVAIRSLTLLVAVCNAVSPSLTNIALNKPSQQSNPTNSYLQDSRAYKANDGNTDGYYPNGSCVWIEQIGGETWWMVDLLAAFEIPGVTISTRSGSPTLYNYYIYVSDSNPKHHASYPNMGSLGQLCTHQASGLPYGSTTYISCSQAILGRYVTIFRNDGASDLIFCELQVYLDLGLGSTQNIHTYNMVVSENTRASATVVKEYAWTRSKLACIALCNPPLTDYVTGVQFQKSSGHCQCLEMSGLSEHYPPTSYDTDWDLAEVPTN